MVAVHGRKVERISMPETPGSYVDLQEHSHNESAANLMKSEYRLPQNIIILGFSGSMGSGCTFLSKGFEAVSNYRYKRLSVSDVLRRILREQGNYNPSVDELQNKGNELRKEHSTSYLIYELMNTELRDFQGHGLIIDGIKNEGEVQVLRRHWPNFYLFSVQADRDVRRKRCLDDGRFKSSGDFDIADLRDQLEQDDFGQQVKKCDYLSDIVIDNSHSIPKHAESQKEDYTRMHYNQYVKLIEGSLNINQTIRERPAPNKNELCMTIAYALSTMSSCIKRKVGAVIVEEARSKVEAQECRTVVSSIPFIVSSGYNEVPLGLNKCLFDEPYQKCYRDFLQEEHAKGYKFCPKCGQAMNLQFVCSCGAIHDKFTKHCGHCKREIDFKHICECGTDVFSHYLPGGKTSPGKLLDMCRALHAEEMALLRLAKTGRGSNDNLLLYSTTQPCNLCANKIVASGIKHVVFAEPYSMKESEDIFQEGNVTTERFQGVKSSAYFKLYR